LDVLGGQRLPAESKGSGRLELANWLTDPQNPLTARVLANRIWQQHFGRGLVETANDFGTRGAAPSHPELLDWLAGELVRSGWSVKHLHRLIVCSAAYQGKGTGSLFPTPRRLDAEQLRDAILAVCDTLDRSPGGPHPFPPEAQWNYTQHDPFGAVYDAPRRSVYLMVQRIKRHPFLGLFDGADPNATTPRRAESTVPTQALYFLNDPFVHEQSARLASRLAKHSSDARARVDFACRLLFARPATDADQADAEQFLGEYSAALADRPEDQRAGEAWAAWCRVMLSSNEFLYVE
jgi:hypothetical protein